MRQDEPTVSMLMTPNWKEERESRATIQWLLSNLMKQADRNLMKFNEGECKGRITSSTTTGCGQTAWKAALQTTSLGEKGQQDPELHQQMPAGSGKWFSFLFGTCETTPVELCPVLGGWSFTGTGCPKRLGKSASLDIIRTWPDRTLQPLI